MRQREVSELIHTAGKTWDSVPRNLAIESVSDHKIVISEKLEVGYPQRF